MNQAVSHAPAVQTRSVRLFLDSRTYRLAGVWEWELFTDTVFCSNVMLPAPEDFMGTRGIIHPEDISEIRENLSLFANLKYITLRFRIITSYGELKSLAGSYITLEEHPLHQPSGEAPLFRQKLAEIEALKEAEHLYMVREVGKHNERVNESGSFYIDVQTGKGWYSDYVFRIHGLPIQSLNAHIHTFSPYIHPDDRETVKDAFDRAYRQQLPLHLQYRIHDFNKEEKYLRLVTQWNFGLNGNLLVSGIIQDVTHEKMQEENAERLQQELSFQKQMVYLDEQTAKMGHWYLNLLTRKIIFSDNCYRIHGIKHKAAVAGINSFLALIHPDDMERVQLAFKNLNKDHQLPEIEYRIRRGDGKTRYIRQSGRSIAYGGEMVIYGVMQDITAEMFPANKLKELARENSLRNIAIAQSEQVVQTGNWILETHTGRSTWSDGLISLLGYKTQSIEPSVQQFLKIVLPEDRKKLGEYLQRVVAERTEASVDFSIMRFGVKRFIKGFFKSVQHDGQYYMVANFLDITAGSTLEQQLHEKMQMARALTENIFDRISITDIHNNIIFWSRQCEQLYGIKGEEAIGKNYFDVLPHMKTDKTLVAFSKALRNERIHYPAAWSAHNREYQEQHMIPLVNEQKLLFGVLHINRNITKEVELQRSLSERLRFIESLVEASVDRVIVLDRNMNFQYWNKRAEEYYGIFKNEVLDKNILEVFPGFINDPSYQEFRTVIKGKMVHISALENLEKKKGYFETYLIPIKDEHDEVTTVLWVVHNLINEYRLMQQQRKASFILDSMNELYIELDHQARLRYVNRRAEILWNTEKEHLVGKTFWEVLPEQEDSELRIALETSLSNRQELRGEFHAASKKLWLYLSATPTDHGLIVLFYDITESKMAREQLATEHRRLREAQAIGKLGSFEWDAATDRIFWSDELYLIHGMEPQSEEITISRVFSFIHPEDAAETIDKVNACMTSGGSYTIINRIRRADGVQRIVKRQFRSFNDAEGRVTHLSGTIQDITEQKKAEELLGKHLQILQQTEEMAQIGSWEFDLRTRQFSWSEGMYRLFGLENGSPVAPGIYTRYALAEEKVVAHRIVHNLSNGIPFDEILQIQTGDGIRILKVKGTVVSDEEGQPKKMYGVDLDITDASKAEEAIRQGRYLLEQTTRTTPDAIVIYDLQAQQPVYLNNCLAEWIGYTNEELVQMGSEKRIQLIHPEHQKKLLRFNKEMQNAKDGDVNFIEYSVQARNGKWLWIRNRSKVFLRNEDGGVHQILSVLQDNTGEVVLRNQLWQRTQYAESVIDASIDRIMVLDREQKVIAWNRRTEEMTGIKREQALGKAYAEIFPKVYQDDTLKNGILSALSGNPVFLPAMKGVYTNSFYERFYLPLKNTEEETYAVVVLMHDVSDMVNRSMELKQLNQTLREKNKELEQKNEEITHFAFVASHDLKEPLRKINTFASFLLERESENISNTGKAYLEKISAAVKRMDLLIADIMVLTKIHADSSVPELIDLNQVLADVKEHFRETIEQSGAHISSEHLPLIHGNKNQLFYLFGNLLSNSLKFHLPGKYPVISIWSEEVSGNVAANEAVKDHPYLKICVMDKGIGFDNHYSKKIFQVFQRLHGRQEYAGTGMGLAICKKIMENHQGFITAAGMPGEGATFCCYFPDHG